jgi:hypothetical protein
MPSLKDLRDLSQAQLAAEAFLVFGNGNLKTGAGLDDALKEGNRHASKFTVSELQKFKTTWTVMSQEANTTTGSAARLLQNNISEEYVLAFRSTEFIDDAVRDNKATNDFEIKDTGWAWVKSVTWKTVRDAERTGWASLWQAFFRHRLQPGGHLATAFNLFHPGAAGRS